MAKTLKRKTVNGTTVKLVREENQFPQLSDSKYQYVVREEGGGTFEDPLFDKSRAKSEFEATVDALKKGI
ncbi:hypothetical protein SAMN05443574_12420 [Haloarcula vallismortis]|uniref:Uncharacterized protein n=2 Tax=Haloarcula vallismortis TaxID=28442 RepID=M0JPQ0_HALVA|nr:hypothetical protein [Haloarcula vallismortis]EMA09949.1 hypothetical protein C437_04810 [Haloarcula vallismortis ATCC 29715]SDX27975.1 hypothetical protein SAMN05443574_12420 [Haloarcula vallismortis]